MRAAMTVDHWAQTSVVSMADRKAGMTVPRRAANLAHSMAAPKAEQTALLSVEMLAACLVERTAAWRVVQMERNWVA